MGTLVTTEARFVGSEIRQEPIYSKVLAIEIQAAKRFNFTTQSVLQNYSKHHTQLSGRFLCKVCLCKIFSN